MDAIVAQLETKMRTVHRPKTFHAQRLHDQLLAKAAAEALAQAELDPVKDENHRLAVELLTRLAGGAA